MFTLWDEPYSCTSVITSKTEELETYLLPQLHIKQKAYVRYHQCRASMHSSFLFVAIHESTLNVVIVAYSSLMMVCSVSLSNCRVWYRPGWRDFRALLLVLCWRIAMGELSLLLNKEEKEEVSVITTDVLYFPFRQCKLEIRFWWAFLTAVFTIWERRWHVLWLELQR